MHPETDTPTARELEELFAEIDRYLDTVSLFRAEGLEPRFANDEALPDGWALEWGTDALTTCAAATEPAAHVVTE
jgi:hypothetical protein